MKRFSHSGKAARLQDALNFNEPPDWPHSMRLYLGAATLLKAGRPKDAEGVYQEELRDLHDNGWTLFGLWQSVRAQDRSARRLGRLKKDLRRAWRDADVALSAPAARSR